MLTFCPNCSNMLIISRCPPPLPSDLVPASARASMPQRAGGVKIVDGDAEAALAAAEAADTDADPDASSRPYRFECRSCPYQYVLDRAWAERRRFTRKKAEDVVGGADAWRNVDRTDVNCPDDKCPGTRAYFMQVQIRSADEPMTSFFKCEVCGREWRD